MALALIRGFSPLCAPASSFCLQREYRIHPIKWTAPQLESWLRARSPQFADQIPKDLTGKVIMRWGPSQFSAFFGAKGGDLQGALRDEAVRCDAEKRQSF